MCGVGGEDQAAYQQYTVCWKQHCPDFELLDEVVKTDKEKNNIIQVR